MSVVSSRPGFDSASQLFYVADTGNGRVVVLDTTTGELGAALSPNYDGCVQHEVLGSKLETLVDSDAGSVQRPSGLAIDRVLRMEPLS